MQLPTSPAEIRRIVRDRISTDNQLPSVLYSGPHNESIKLTANLAKNHPSRNNHNRAVLYADVTGANIIDKTEAGHILDNRETNLYDLLIKARVAEAKAHQNVLNKPIDQNVINEAIERGTSQADGIFSLTSRGLCSTMSGAVRTYVCGAGADRVFRKDELETLIQNRDVKTINGVPREKFEKHYQNDLYGSHAPAHGIGLRPNLKQTFRAICLTELRQDRAQALRTGDPALIRDVIMRREIYRQQQAQERNPSAQPEPIDAIKQRIEQRTESTTARAQNRNRTEASIGINAIIADREAKGLYTTEQTRRARQKLQQKLSDPHKAYRINTGLKMNALLKAVNAGDITAVKHYTQLFSDLLTDTRMIAHLQTHQKPPQSLTNGQALVAEQDGQIFAGKLNEKKRRAYGSLVQQARAHQPQSAKPPNKQSSRHLPD